MENLKTLVTLQSSSLCFSSKPHLRIFTTKHVNLGGSVSLKRPMMKVKAKEAERDYREYISLDVPLELRTMVGKFLCGVMQDDAKCFPLVAIDELKVLKNERDSSLEKLSLTKFNDSVDEEIYRKIAEFEEKERRIAIQEIMYLYVISKFDWHGIPLLPKMSKCHIKRTLQLMPYKNKQLETIHTKEIMDIIMEFVSTITCLHEKDSETTRDVQINRLARFYVLSALYGYFLKSVSYRYNLEKCLSLSYHDLQIGHGIRRLAFRGWNNSWRGFSIKKEYEVENFKDYVEGFKIQPKLMKEDCKMRSKEALELVLSHTQELFENKDLGKVDYNNEDHFYKASRTHMHRLFLEGFNFGSFLWMAEDFVEEIYELKDY